MSHPPTIGTARAGDAGPASGGLWKLCCARLVILGFCVLLSEVHLGALQVMAWTEMAFRYSQTDGAVAGLLKTFNGAHPCSRCHVVKKAAADDGRKSPSQSAARGMESAELKYVLSVPTGIIEPAWCLSFPDRPDFPALKARFEEPDTPVPRFSRG